jgi:putative ABC transport system permease protein
VVPKFDADLVMISSLRPNLDVDVSFPRSRLYQAKGFEGVVSATPLYVKTGMWKVPGTGDQQAIRLYAFPIGRPTLLIPGLADHLQTLQLPRTVLFDRLSRPYYGPHAPGTIAEVNDRRIHVVGEVPFGINFNADGNLFMSVSTCVEILGAAADPDKVDYGMIRVRPGTNLQALADAMARDLPNDVVVLTKEGLIQKVDDFYSAGGILTFVFGLGAMVGFVIGVIVCYQILYTDIADHIKQLATLKAIGRRDGWLMRLVLSQAFMLGVFGFLAGMAATQLLYIVFENLTAMPMRFTPGMVSLVLGLTIGMCLFAGLIAMRKVLEADPADCFG